MSLEQAVPSSPALADEAQRLRALDPSSSFHLEAPAGSGKTFLLTARFLRLLGLVDHPQQILALTFTNKAAGEMRERVAKHLHRARKGHAPTNALDAELLASAAAALERHHKYENLLLGGEILRIQTFHSFCYALVSQAPLEAGIPPGSTLLVDPDQVFLRREVIDKTLVDISTSPPDNPLRRALENRLLYLNNTWYLLVRELEELMERREALSDLMGVLDLERASSYVTQGIRELVEVELSALERAFGSCALGLSWSEFLEHLSACGAGAASSLPPEVPRSVWEDLPAWRCIADTLLTKAGDLKRKVGPSSGFYSGFAKTEWFERMQGIDPATVEKLDRIRGLPDRETGTPDLDALWDLVLLLTSVMDKYRSRCKRQHLLDFIDLEAAALRLFSTAAPSDLQLLLDHQIRHVLVDEFQDTSNQQWKLLRLLCAEWSAEEGRTVFLVGDPKQSIYGFRKAEVRLFLEARDGLPLDEFRRFPLEPVVLHTNFRSEPQLVDWCNDLFGGTVMADPKPEFDEAPFAPAVAYNSPRSSDANEPSLSLSLFIPWPDAAAARTREAEWLAGRISEDLKNGNPEAETGILLFARTHLPVYLEALQRWGVAVQVAEGLKLVERPEVQYLWQLCRALVFPHDNLAWASQLRSPWLMLSYSEVLAVKFEEPEPWVEKIRSYAEKNELVAAFWEKLRPARQHLGHEPLADVLEEAWLDLGGARKAASMWGTRGLACCRRFFDLIRQAECFEPVRTLTRLGQLLDYAFEPIDPDTAFSRVSLMTVHRAKGLEFDTVYLPFLDWDPVFRERRNQPPYLLERIPGPSERHLLAARPDRLHGEPDPIYNWLHDLHINRRWGEAKRLFYVAATRARSRLFLSGVLSWRKGKSPAFPKESSLAWLDEHYGLSDALDIDSIERPEECDATAIGDAQATGPDRDGSQDVRSCPRCNVRPSMFQQDLPQWEKTWISENKDFQVSIEPLTSGPPPSDPEDAGPVVLNPAPFERETPLLRVLHPSSFSRPVEEKPEVPAGAAVESGESSGAPRTWGTLIHRLLELYGKEKKLPSEESVFGYLRRQGVREEEAREQARLALREVDACLGDQWLSECYAAPADQLFVEYPIESLHSSRTLYAGVIDLAVLRDGNWWLIDFKTSRPSEGERIEDFCRNELQTYSPQLRAYREMWARVMGVGEASVETAIYWTALRRWSSMGETGART